MATVPEEAEKARPSVGYAIFVFELTKKSFWFALSSRPPLAENYLDKLDKWEHLG